jgi:hypothetical protein
MTKIVITNDAGVTVEWTKEKVKENILTNDKAFYRALVRIYNNQTFDEKTVEQTKHHNDLGFNGVDAKFLSSIASQYLRKGELSVKQIALGRKKLAKYAGQIFDYMQAAYADKVVKERAKPIKVQAPALQLELVQESNPYSQPAEIHEAVETTDVIVKVKHWSGIYHKADGFPKKTDNILFTFPGSRDYELAGWPTNDAVFMSVFNKIVDINETTQDVVFTEEEVKSIKRNSIAKS